MRIKPPNRRPAPPPQPEIQRLPTPQQQRGALTPAELEFRAERLRPNMQVPPETPEYQAAAAEQLKSKFEGEAEKGPVDAEAVGRIVSGQLHRRLADRPAGTIITAHVAPGDSRQGISEVEANTLRELQNDPRVTPSGSQAITAFLERSTQPAAAPKPLRIEDGLEERRPAPVGGRGVRKPLRLENRETVRSVGRQGRALEATRAQSTGEAAAAADPNLRPGVERLATGKKGKVQYSLDSETREKYRDVLKSIGVPDNLLSKADDTSLVKNIARVEKDLATNNGQIKTEFKKFKVTSKFDKEGNLVDVKVKEKQSGLKKALGVILKVASFIPGPIGIVARTVSAVQGGIAAVRGGNLLGGIASVLGGVSGLGGLPGAAGRAFSGISQTAGRIANTIGRVGNAVDAIRNRDIGGLLGSIGGNNPNITRLASIANGVQAARNGDIGGAIGALGAATGNDRLQTVGNAVSAIRNRDIGGVLGAVGTLTGNQRVGQVGDAISAVQNRDIGGFIGAVGNLTGNQGLLDFADAGNTAAAIRNGVRSGDFAAVNEAFAGAGGRVTTPQQQERLVFVNGVIQAFGEIRAERRSNEQSVPLPQTEGLAQALEAAGLGPLASRLRAANDNVEAAMQQEDPAVMDAALQQLDETLDRGVEEFTDDVLAPTG